MAAIVGGAFLSASVDKLVGMIMSGEIRDFFRKTKLDIELLDDVKTELLRLRSVLRDAGDRQFTDDLVKEWLNTLQDAVFQAEDLFDEINTEALRRNVEAHQVLKKISSYFKMEIVDLPNLESFSIDDLPITLRELIIGNVGGIWNTTWKHLTSLSVLTLYYDDIVKGLMKSQVPCLPTNLVTLQIYRPGDIECLDGKWLQHLTSLHTLHIREASKLKSLPEKGELPSSLKKLYIAECPLLEENLKMKQGKEWLKISHIPQLYVNYKIIE